MCSITLYASTVCLRPVIRLKPEKRNATPTHAEPELLAMVVHRGQKTERSRSHFSPFLRGVIYGLLLAGWTLSEIADEVEKPDGTSPTQQAIAGVAKQLKTRGGMTWDGTASSSTAAGVGRPRATTDALDKAIRKVVCKFRGRAKVDVSYIQKVLKAARKVCRRTIARRLGEAGLAWLRRRHKFLVPVAHRSSRLDFAAWTLARTASTLARWAYTDGTTFYLGRCQSQVEDKIRGALGPFVWRQTNGHDALFEDCIGPSSYWKAQGQPVKIWGLLLAGLLSIWVMPQGENMNAVWYQWVIEHKFPLWIRKALGRKAKGGVYLVQDHEKCLWKDATLKAMREHGINLLKNYPKCSQDLNAIENAWRELRARLYVTQPVKQETREAFIIRLRAAVSWINVNRAAYLAEICGNQKERAIDVQNATPPGGRTKH